MWWDSTEITLADSVMFSALSLLILSLVGLGVYKLLAKFSRTQNITDSFDPLQKVNFYLFFGFIALTFFLLLFSFANLPYAVSSMIIIVLAAIGLLIWRPKIKLHFPQVNRKSLLLVASVLFVVLVVIFSNSALIAGSYGSTNDDGADHTAIVRLILDQPAALLRWGPQGDNFPIGYTTGTHMLLAFLLTVANVALQKIVIMTGVFLPVLVALSCYFSLHCLFKNRLVSLLGLVISGVFAVGSFWVPTSWGGLPLLLSFFICFTGIGLIYMIVLEQKMSGMHAFFLGLIFFVASQTYPHALLVLSMWFLFVLFAKFLPQIKAARFRSSTSEVISKRNLGFLGAFILPLLASFPLFFWLYRQIAAGAQLGIQSDGVDYFASLVAPRIGFDWLFDFAGLSTFFSSFGYLFALVPLALVLLIALLVPRVSRFAASLFGKVFSRNFLLTYSLIVSIFAFLAITIYFNVNVLLAFLNSERTVQHLIVPAVMLVSVVLFLGWRLMYAGSKRLYSGDFRNLGSLRFRRVLAVVLAGVLVFSVCVLSVPVANQQSQSYDVCIENLQIFKTLAPDDLALMQWMRQNLSSDDKILVSMGDSGQYVYSLAQKHVISRFTPSRNYSDLVGLLAADASDPRAIPILEANNVTHVYIGSIGVTYAQEDAYYRHFNATQFAATPYFSLTRQVGDVYLFRVNLE